MAINRRLLLAGLAAAPPAAAQTAAVAPPAPPAPVPVEQRLLTEALKHVHAMSFDGGAFSGPGWDLVVSEGRACEFTLLGEEHGTAEVPVFARALYAALQPAGYDTLAIEISPPIAQDLDQAARGGIEGIRLFEKEYPPGPAFYFWRTEAEMIAAIRTGTPGKRDVLWGLDYEVTSDRRLIARLKAKAPASAAAALDALDKASLAAWDKWRATHNPGALFTFSGDPALVRALRAAWSKPDADAAMLMATLEETLEINALFPGKAWQSNERRSGFMRANLARRLSEAAAQGRKPKVMIKMGESHVMRGVSWTGNFDVGSLAAEAATLRGGKAFAILAGGGAGAVHGVLDPTVIATRPAPVDMFDQLGLGFLIAALKHNGPAVVDLRPLRPMLASTGRLKAFNNPEAVKTIFSFDVLLVWNGSTPAKMLMEG